MSSLDRVRERRRLADAGATPDELETFDDDTLGPRTPSGRATGDDVRQLRRRARRQEQPAHDAYRAGRREAGAGAGGRRRRAPASARRAGRQIARPVQRQLASGFQLLGVTLGLILLYQLLTTAEAAPKQLQGVLAAPASALRWLANPHAVVLPN